VIQGESRASRRDTTLQERTHISPERGRTGGIANFWILTNLSLKAKRFEVSFVANRFLQIEVQGIPQILSFLNY
jgi:hypothetical protein